MATGLDFANSVKAYIDTVAQAVKALTVRVRPPGGSATGGDQLIVGAVNDIAPDLGMVGVLSGGKPNYENVIGGQIDSVDTSTSNLPTVEGTGADYSFIVAGYDNVNNAHSTIISGYHCKAEGPSTTHCAIVGGSKHSIPSGVNYSTIVGGTQNEVTGDFAAVIGGAHNKAAGGCTVIGFRNEADGSHSTIGGGRENETSAGYATVSGGYQNNASANAAVVGGGYLNKAEGNYATVTGGGENTAEGNYATVAGGRENTASGLYSTVLGGQDNIAAGLHTVTMGTSARAEARGSVAHAAGHFTTPGDAQRITALSRREVTGAALTEVHVAGSSERLVLPDHATWLFEMHVVARSTTGESAAYRITGAIERGDGAATTALIGTPVVAFTAEDEPEWDVQVTALASSVGALRVQVAGEDDKTIRWVIATTITQVTTPPPA